MGMRFLPFSKARKGWQFAGQGADDGGGGGGGGYTLPVASANTLGGVKVGSGLSITNDGTLSASGGGGGGAISDFSYTETNTGVKWVDGKDIYKISFALTNITNGQQVIDVTALNISEAIFYFGNVDVNGNGTRWRLTGNDTGSAYWYLEFSDNKIYSNMSGIVASNRNGTITIFYTKNS